MTLTLRRAGIKEVRGHFEKWHYSGCVPTGRNYVWVWEDDEGIYASAIYGDGVNPNQAKFLARVAGAPVTTENFLELTRVARREPKKDGVHLTQFLAAIHKEILHLGYFFIVSFSDPMHSHDGTLYRAANFKHIGKTDAQPHVIDGDGVIRHRRYAKRYADRHGMSIAEARGALGLSIVKTQPKDRWFISLIRPRHWGRLAACASARPDSKPSSTPERDA